MMKVKRLIVLLLIGVLTFTFNMNVLAKPKVEVVTLVSDTGEITKNTPYTSDTFIPKTKDGKLMITVSTQIKTEYFNVYIQKNVNNKWTTVDTFKSDETIQRTYYWEPNQIYRIKMNFNGIYSRTYKLDAFEHYYYE